MDIKTKNPDTQKLLAGVKIPPCPDVLVEVMNLLKQPDVGTDQIAQFMQRDAGMAAALLKLTNSPLYAKNGRISSVSQAITILGMKAVHNLLFHVSLRQTMAGNPPNFEKFWERSALIAATSARVARKINIFSHTIVSQDDAYITGLFNDCGIPILISTFPNYRKVMIAKSNVGQDVYKVENEYFTTDHAVVGGMMTASWFLPDHVSKAIRYQHDKTIYMSPGDRIDRVVIELAGIIHMAEMIVDAHFCQINIEWEEISVDVLRYFAISDQDFAELKEDTLGWLSGEH